MRVRGKIADAAFFWLVLFYIFVVFGVAFGDLIFAAVSLYTLE